jgi:hypothetical protein
VSALRWKRTEEDVGAHRVVVRLDRRGSPVEVIATPSAIRAWLAGPARAYGPGTVEHRITMAIVAAVQS